MPEDRVTVRVCLILWIGDMATRKEWEDPAWRAGYNKSRRDAFKKTVFDYYGNKCACCGEDEFLFLTIDHINNDGLQDVQPSGRRRGGKDLYAYIAIREFPDGYQLLCRNCNWGKHANGGICPHQNGG